MDHYYISDAQVSNLIDQNGKCNIQQKEECTTPLSFPIFLSMLLLYCQCQYEDLYNYFFQNMNRIYIPWGIFPSYKTKDPCKIFKFQEFGVE